MHWRNPALCSALGSSWEMRALSWLWGELSFLLEGHTFFKRLPLPAAPGNGSQPWKTSGCLKKTPNAGVFQQLPWCPQAILALLEMPNPDTATPEGAANPEETPRVICCPQEGSECPRDRPQQPWPSTATSELLLLLQTEGISIPLPWAILTRFEGS